MRVRGCGGLCAWCMWCACGGHRAPLGLAARVGREPPRRNGRRRQTPRKDERPTIRGRGGSRGAGSARQPKKKKPPNARNAPKEAKAWGPLGAFRATHTPDRATTNDHNENEKPTDPATDPTRGGGPRPGRIRLRAEAPRGRAPPQTQGPRQTTTTRTKNQRTQPRTQQGAGDRARGASG